MSNATAGGRTAEEKQNLFARFQASFIFRMLSSLVLAVIVWLIINSSYVNAPTSNSYTPALLQLNRSALDRLNLELLTETFNSVVEVEVKGRQEDIAKLKTSDFEAYIDFADVTGADVESLKVELRSTNTENVSIVRIEPSTVPIQVENRATRLFDIEVRFTGEPSEGFYRTNYGFYPTTRSLTAHESLIDQIAGVYVEADLGDLAGNTVLHQQCHIVNDKGEEIQRSGWEQVVDITLEISKEVPIIADVTGSPYEDYYVRYTTATPESVMINGTKDALDKVSDLYTETLDIGAARQSVSQERAILLPNNVRLSQDTLPRAVVDVTIYRFQYTQDYSLSKGRIEFMNNQSDYRYEIVENEVPLLLKGKVDDIANLDSGQISAVVDVGGLAPGTHAVTAIVSMPDGVFNVYDILLTVIVASN